MGSMRRRCLVLNALLASGLSACSDDAAFGPASDGVTSPDAGQGSDAAASGSTTVAPPALTPCPEGWAVRPGEGLGFAECEPWPDSSPVAWVCPPGWRRVVRGGVETCDPFPEGGAQDCGIYEAHYPGQAECRVVGTECPAGDFPEGLPPDANVVFVQSGFQDGDGANAASPLGSLYDVDFGSLPSGTIVALAKGTHRWTGRLGRPVTLWGACPAETVLTSPRPLPVDAPPAVMAVDGTAVTLNRAVLVKNLRVADTPQWGFWVRGRLPLRLEGVIVERAEAVGLLAEVEGRLSGEDVVVRRTRPVAPGGFGRALSVESGAYAELRKVIFARSGEAGVAVSGPASRLVLEDAVVSDGLGQPVDQSAGSGLNAQAGATVEVRRTAFERNRSSGLSMVDEGTHVVLEDVVIRDTQSEDSDRGGGRGLSVNSGARVRVRGALLERNREVGVEAIGPDTRLQMAHVVVRDTRSQEGNQAFGRGLSVRIGARAEVRRAVFEGNRETGILAGDGDTVLVLEDAVVRNTQSQEADKTRGRGLELQFGARAEVRRILVTGNRGVGVYVSHAGTSLLLEDAVLRETRAVEADNTGGRGLGIELGATAVVRRVTVARNRDHGVVVTDEGSRLFLEDALIRDTQSRASDRFFGRGFSAQRGATAELRRAAIYQNFNAGFYASDAPARLFDVSIDGVRQPPCAEASPPCFTTASGLVAVLDGTELRLERVRVARIEQCAVLVAGGAQVDGTEVRLSESGIGACFDDPVYDTGRLGAEFLANLQRVAFEGLPPAPAPADRIAE